MAIVPRAAAPAPAASMQAASRSLSGVRSVASVDGGPIEEMSAYVGVTNNQAAFHDNYSHDKDRDNRERERTLQVGHVHTSTKAFASVFSSNGAPSEAKDKLEMTNVNGLLGLLGYAINIYETNARVVSNNNGFAGTNISRVF